MTVIVRKTHPRIRSKKQLAHAPNTSNRRKGRWQHRDALWKAYRLARRRRAMANESRRRNRC